MLKRLAMGTGLVFLVACSSLPANVEREASWALERPESTGLGKLLAPDVARHPGESGFIPLTAGTNAFLLRSAFAGLAEKTLDLQYYLWEVDLTGQLLLRDVIHAADRGVRVRLLLDDIHTDGKTDAFAIADAHPNIEVRLFNPFANRDFRAAELVTDGMRLNHRMHNKVIIPDNALAITGGRNIGDHYFAVDESSNFRDLDLLAAGPVVRALSGMFDTYWNSEWAYPIASVTGERHAADEVDGLARLLDRRIGRHEKLPFALDADRAAMKARVANWRRDFMWGPAEVVYDSPEKVEGKGPPHVAKLLMDATEGVRHELLVETAYFVPGESGVEILRQLVDRGVDVAVLTNSLATNDSVAAHSGYMQFRAELLTAGIQLFELRPDAAAQQQQMTLLASHSEAALHTKALVYDGKVAFIGSFNLDPRSLLINTEMGVLIRSESLAVAVADIIRRGMQPSNSYQLVLNDGEVRWIAGKGDDVTMLEHEPQTSWWLRMKAWALGLLPVTGQL